jgi:hypothetical protein
LARRENAAGPEPSLIKGLRIEEDRTGRLGLWRRAGRVAGSEAPYSITSMPHRVADLFGCAN